MVSSYGSVITLTHAVDLATASFLKGKFVEVLIAPSFHEDALAFLKAKSKDIRLIETGPLEAPGKIAAGIEYRFVRGALLAQSPDDQLLSKLEPVRPACAMKTSRSPASPIRP